MLAHKCMIHIKLWGVIFTRPRIIHSLSSSESGNSVVHSGNQSTFSMALGWPNSKICETKRRKQHRRKKNSRLFCIAAYLWFITPVNIEFPLKALQSETEAPSPSLSRSLHNLFASLSKLPQTFPLTKAHLGLKVQEVQENKIQKPKTQERTEMDNTGYRRTVLVSLNYHELLRHTVVHRKAGGCLSSISVLVIQGCSGDQSWSKILLVTEGIILARVWTRQIHRLSK